MPTRESETNLRRFSAGAISGASVLTCVLTVVLKYAYRHHLRLRHVPIRSNTSPHGLPNTIGER